MTSKLPALLDQAVKDGKVPHAIYCATNADGSWTASHTTGAAVHGSPGDITDDAEFMLASSTKLLATIIVLQAVEKGVIGLDDSVDDIIPELSKQGVLEGFDADDKPIIKPKTNALTLRLLLTHSSGHTLDAVHPDLTKYLLQRDPGWKSSTQPTVEERYTYPLIFEPGTAWTYGGSIDWAGKVVERLTKSTLEELLQAGICEPLGVKSLTFFPYTGDKAETLGKKVPALTSRNAEGELMLHTEPFMNINPKDGMGGHGAYGSMPDYLAVLRSLLANDSKLLSPSTVEMMFTPQLTPASASSLAAVMKSPMAAFFIGEWVPSLELNWGLGGILLMKDGDGRRKKGTLSWGGVANTFWLVDRAADVALTFGTQVLPPGDKGVEGVITGVERGVYGERDVKF